MLVVVPTMSSSRNRVIRSGEPQLPYALAPLGEALPELSTGVFRPITFGCDEPQEVEAEPEPPTAPPSIPEEDALRMVGEARAEGVEEGRAQAWAEVAKVTGALAQALMSAASLRAQLMHEAEEDLLKLSVLIARKVMLRELSCDPGIMAGLVRGALEVASDREGIVVRLNPDEYQVVANCRDFEELLREDPRISLKADTAIGPAGCLIETVRGNIDAGVDAQLEEIFRRLCDEKSGRRNEEDDRPAAKDDDDPPPAKEAADRPPEREAADPCLSKEEAADRPLETEAADIAEVNGAGEPQLAEKAADPPAPPRPGRTKRPRI